MTAAYQDRIQRLRRLEAALPKPGRKPEDCMDGARMLEILSEVYGADSPSARRRALQRDLEELLKEGRIEVVNPGGKPLRYRRCADDPDEDPLIWEYTLQQVRDLIAEAVPARRLDRLWRRLLSEVDAPLLDEQRLRIIPDNVRLQPVELYPDILQAVITALAQRCALQVLYEDAEAVRGEAQIHPQALVQRGPIPYLFALKNDEAAPVRLYALHRMIRAEVLTGTPARAAAGFDLDRAIAQGKVDFGQGELIDLELRVRGYLTEVLRVCPLSEGQRIEDEPEDSAFTLRFSARVPSTGQLLRWLLGAGPNLEVLAPADLRHVMAVQTAKMAGVYQAQ
ncbi:MAG: WYL domain-containing protein [Chromatiaceae bacterium]|nr:MAG: WYL domain-containing protein [Chromatiaceae bacterium]